MKANSEVQVTNGEFYFIKLPNIKGFYYLLKNLKLNHPPFVIRNHCLFFQLFFQLLHILLFTSYKNLVFDDHYGPFQKCIFL